MNRVNMIKDSFLTVQYKSGFILSYQWRSEITGKSGEEISYCPFDVAGAFLCKSRHAAKLAITKYIKTNNTTRGAQQ